MTLILDLTYLTWLVIVIIKSHLPVSPFAFRYYVNTWLLMVSIYALIFCLLFFSLTNISTITHKTLDAKGNVLTFTWEVSNSGVEHRAVMKGW